jgi:hypothetical protein
VYEPPPPKKKKKERNPMKLQGDAKKKEEPGLTALRYVVMNTPRRPAPRAAVLQGTTPRTA